MAMIFLQLEGAAGSHQGTLGTLELPSIGSRTSHGPSDPKGSKVRPFFYKVHSMAPLNMRSLWKSTMAQGTLLDLNGPRNGPCEINFWAPLVKKGFSWVLSWSKLVNLVDSEN